MVALSDLWPAAQRFPYALALRGNGYDWGFPDRLVWSHKALNANTPHGFSALREAQSWGTPYYGLLGYDLKNELEDLRTAQPATVAFPDALLFAPEHEAAYEAPASSSSLSPVQQPDHLEASLSEESYLAAAYALQQHIHRGDIYEVNLCLEFRLNQPGLDPLLLFEALNQRSPMPFSYLLKNESHYLIGSSPERYLKREGTSLISEPIKGTAPRDPDPHRDRANVNQLQLSKKERAENLMIVDLVRNDLTRCADGLVSVPKLLEVRSFPGVHQLVSIVHAEVKAERTPLELIAPTFPMGSMTGAPKIAAMQLCEQYEGFRRGAYSGALGWFDAKGDFDLCVVIRSLQYDAQTGQLAFQVGSAITALADPKEEYRECLLKAQALLGAISDAAGH